MAEWGSSMLKSFMASVEDSRREIDHSGGSEAINLDVLNQIAELTNLELKDRHH
ncbi:MAG: hypothetical protein Kow0042_12850 [Calditrichia bacterium]